ncbi:hypothetical protein [Algoriphagus litoralis]|uniref:hypothetical protein n=1 Tax=Algoriphagus litoralis TaxID=2202829 RepID=UPI000DB8FB84|nr:hypothetical protein [Algoriphagus litoralis]
MKITLTFFFSIFFYFNSFGQNQQLPEVELENFVLVTDQDIYLSGDRVWFAAKLLKNHSSYRYSKLAYIQVLDGEGNTIHQEKMLLTGEDLIYGDFFIPENSVTGVFSLLIYSKWMANFEDFPIAKREFLVANSTTPRAQGNPALFWEKVPFENASISLFHTSDRAEVIEIQDSRGNTLEVLEAVPPLKKTLSSIKPESGYTIVYRNSSFQISAQKWFWDPSDFTLVTKEMPGKGLKIVTHTDWMILEELGVDSTRVELDRQVYEALNSFDISVLDPSGKLLWTYRVQVPAKSQGEISITSKGTVGEALDLNLVDFSEQYHDGLVMAKELSDPLISDFVALLNHPNWINLTSKTADPDLITALHQPIEDPLLVKDYSPMFDYKPWSIAMDQRFKSAVSKSGFSYFLPDVLLDPLVNRRLYKENFEIAEEVVALQSPFEADKVYHIEDYFEFRDLEAFLKEVVPQVRLKKSKVQDYKELYIANTDNQAVKFNKKPLVLVDFYKVLSLEEFWNLDLVSVDRIELYYNKSTVETTNLGEAVGDGLIVVYTKNNEFFLKNNLGKDRYFLADLSVPRRPDFTRRATQQISGNALQYLDSGLSFYRGRTPTHEIRFDTAGTWVIEAWVFGNSSFEKVQRRVQIDP